MLTLGSLFDGIGGWLLAAERSGITPMWASEIDPFPQVVTSYHFPNVKQLGDITKLDGARIAPVDIVTMGSPCQDLSIAGKREGLHGERSGLFIRAVELIRSMRRASGGSKPRFIIWENVPGAFSSNRGLDFKTVLEEITEEDIPIPTDAPPRWTKAGMVQCCQCDIAWRVLDAQFFGVPQRRRRIFLVADFGTRTRCAEKILFEPESLPGDTAPGKDAKKGITTAAPTSAGNAGTLGNECILNDQGGQCMNVSFGKTGTLRAQERGHQPIILDLTHADEVVRTVTGDKTQSLNARMGTGGNQTPVIQTFCIAGNVVDRNAKQNGTGISKDVSSTLNTVDKHAVCYSIDRAAFNQGKNAQYDFRIDGTGKNETLTARGPNAVCIGNGQINQLDLQDKAGELNCMHDQQIVAVNVRHMTEHETAGTLQAKDQGGYSLNYQNPIRCAGVVRRLTPLECERLQGLPDNWTWIPGVSCPDSKRYKAIGNGMAQPCADFILRQLMRHVGEG